MEINSKTRLFAVMGDPVEHSVSPQMHNAAFQELGLNCVYAAFRVKAGDLGGAIRGFSALGFGGVNVTIPHKVASMEHLDVLSEDARIIGAVNTLEFKEGRVIGHNTDGTGALRALKEGGVDPAGKEVVILGNGGAARAIGVTLALKGNIRSLTILGRSQVRVNELVVYISKNTGAAVRGGLMEDMAGLLKDADVLINATPVGMHPKVDETLVTADLLHPGISVMDIVYNPLKTRLLKEAERAGCSTIDGIGMLVGQGAEAEGIWLGIEPPVDVMRKAVEKELGI